MKSTGAWSSNELQWLDLKVGHQESSPGNGHQGDMPNSLIISSKLHTMKHLIPLHISGWEQDSAISSAKTLETTQFGTKPIN